MESKNFFILLLEFFQFWGGVQFKESKLAVYSKMYSELVAAGVTFPQRIRFISSPRYGAG